VARRTALASVVATFLLVSGLTAPTATTAGAATTGVTAKLVLSSTRVPAGTPLRGTLVLENPGNHAVDLNEGCAPKWDVVLGRGRTAPDVAFSMECSPEPFRVAPGSSERKFRVGTTGRRPGSYRAFLVAREPSFPSAKPVKVRIVKPR
jgi:hypothetical protein